MKIDATNIVASPPTGTPTAHANRNKLALSCFPMQPNTCNVILKTQHVLPDPCYLVLATINFLPDT